MRKRYQPEQAVPPPKPRRRRRNRIKNFFRGYLMIVGALTTLYVLAQLLVLLLVEAGKWVR